MVIAFGAWFLFGFFAWMAALADFYEIGTKYPILGTADEQWESMGRKQVLPLAVIMLFSGPIGFLTAIIATKFFRTGFRIW